MMIKKKDYFKPICIIPTLISSIYLIFWTIMRAVADSSKLRDLGDDTVRRPIGSSPLLKAPPSACIDPKDNWLFAFTVSVYAHISLYFHP